LLVDKQVDKAAEHGRYIIDTRIGRLAEEVGQQRGCLLVSRPRQGAHFIDDAADQHRLAFAGVAFDPEQPALFVVAPLLEVGMFEDPLIGVS
jgi:hypothetical protein